MERPEHKLTWVDDWGGVIFPAIALGIFAAPITLAAQSIYWLKTGVWPLRSIGDALALLGVSFPPTSWIGVNKAAAFVGDQPLWLGALALGLLVSHVLLRAIKA